MRLRLVSMLERYGYTISIGANGEEGLDIFQRNRERIALVLLDLSLPKLSGQEVLMRLFAAKILAFSRQPGAN